MSSAKEIEEEREEEREEEHILLAKGQFPQAR